jgi:hypothetical protein
VPNRHRALDVGRVKGIEPALAGDIEGDAGEVGVNLVQLVDRPVRLGRPQDVRHGVGKLAELLLRARRLADCAIRVYIVHWCAFRFNSISVE